MSENPSPRTLLVDTQFALVMTQEQLGALIGVSRRTISRWQGSGTLPIPSQLQTLARATYSVNPAIAARLAAAAGATLESLALVPAAPTEPTPATLAMVESVLCAAAEALDASPRAVRPAVVAAFARADLLGLPAGQIVRVLTPPAATPKARRGPARGAKA